MGITLKGLKSTVEKHSWADPPETVKCFYQNTCQWLLLMWARNHCSIQNEVETPDNDLIYDLEYLCVH